MTVQSWSDEYVYSSQAAQPREISMIFLQFVPLVMIAAVLGLVVFLVKVAGNINLVAASQGATTSLADVPVDMTGSEVRADVENSILINSAGTGGMSGVFTAEVQHWKPQIEAWAQSWGLDPNMIATVMQIESCGNPNAVSSAGASGLFQVMPFHFNAGEDHFDPQTNAARGLDYLRRSLEAHDNSIELAFAGYNGGISGSQRPRSAWADETKRYVYWGTGIYAAAAAGSAGSERLDEWMQAGGRSLCRKAAAVLGLQ